MNTATRGGGELRIGIAGYEGLVPCYGDLHSHCDVGYGTGSPEEAYANARLQLDFAAVVAHAAWPDMPADEPHLAETLAYHRRGFAEAARRWPALLAAARAATDEGRFVAFAGFEWHSLRYGDYHVVYREPAGEILHAADLDGLRAALAAAPPAFAIPHHIGYRWGYRGIAWEAFAETLSPVVEIFSLHGAAESDEAPYPYLHTMGPRDGRGTMQHGLRLGHRFGVVGSTDHHAAFPGSYGHGRALVWAAGATRQALWEAIAARRTAALTGDRIAVAVAVDGHPMGSVVRAGRRHRVEVGVAGGDALTRVEVLRDSAVVHRWAGPDARDWTPAHGPALLTVEFGWGPRGERVTWDATLDVEGGALLAVEPRLRGPETVSPTAAAPGSGAGSDDRAPMAWERTASGAVRLRTATWGNPNTQTPGTQALTLTVDAGPGARLVGRVNGRPLEVPLRVLGEHSVAEYLGGFRSPAVRAHRLVPLDAAVYRTAMDLKAPPGPHWYYVRVAQQNGQWAWTSPVWVQVD